MKRLAVLLLAVLSLSASLPERARVTLAWDDNSRDETAFEVQRSADGGVFVLLALLPPNATTYVDDRLRAGVTHTYRVRAVRGLDVSAWTSTVSKQVRPQRSSS